MPPKEYSLIWRFNGSRPISMWMPVAPEGYVAMGAVVLGAADVPSLDDYVCIRRVRRLQLPPLRACRWVVVPRMPASRSC